MKWYVDGLIRFYKVIKHGKPTVKIMLFQSRPPISCLKYYLSIDSLPLPIFVIRFHTLLSSQIPATVCSCAI